MDSIRSRYLDLDIFFAKNSSLVIGARPALYTEIKHILFFEILSYLILSLKPKRQCEVFYKVVYHLRVLTLRSME